MRSKSPKTTYPNLGPTLWKGLKATTKFYSYCVCVSVTHLLLYKHYTLSQVKFFIPVLFLWEFRGTSLRTLLMKLRDKNCKRNIMLNKLLTSDLIYFHFKWLKIIFFSIKCFLLINFCNSTYKRIFFSFFHLFLFLFFRNLVSFYAIFWIMKNSYVLLIWELFFLHIVICFSLVWM